MVVLWCYLTSNIPILFHKEGEKMKRFLLVLLGCIMFSLGTIGFFLPFLPTTVFYLLTAFFWLKSSEKLYNKFITSEKYQKYVKDAIIDKNISTKGMIRMFLMMLVVFLVPALLVNNFIMRISLAVVYSAHIIFLSLYLKGKKIKKYHRKDR